MHDCHKDILAYHDEKATLPQPEQRDMRERRDANRKRLKKGLERDDEPSLSKTESQGSYAHHTMVQQPDKDYDIDDGAYFRAADLIKPNGETRSALDVKKAVRRAIDDGTFKKPPKVRKNCVRIYYAAGYHVDVPVYRDVLDYFGYHQQYELASTDWKESDPARVTKWFNDRNKAKSPDEANGRQLRRTVRLLKAFARSRPSWRKRIATGFMITILIADECYWSDKDREDRALYNTMLGIRNRLRGNRRIMHPVVTGEELTSGRDDAQTGFLLEKLDWALEKFQKLHAADCTRDDALGAWDTAFGTDYFSKRSSTGSNGGGGKGPAVIARPGESWPPWEPADKRGGGRYG